MNYFSPVLLSLHVYLFSLFALNSVPFTPNMIAFALPNNSGHLSLLKFKESISMDPLGILLSWNTSINFCTRMESHAIPDFKELELNLEGHNWKHLISSHWKSLIHDKLQHHEQQPLWGNPTRSGTIVTTAETLFGK